MINICTVFCRESYFLVHLLAGVKWIIKADKYGKIKFCCLQSKTAEPYMELCDMERKDVLRRFIFIEGLGQYHQASTGLDPLLPAA